MVLEEVVTYASNLIALGMVGRLGAFPMGTFSLAHSFTNITGEPGRGERRDSD